MDGIVLGDTQEFLSTETLLNRGTTRKRIRISRRFRRSLDYVPASGRPMRLAYRRVTEGRRTRSNAAFRSGGTESSNPASSSGESRANLLLRIRLILWRGTWAEFSAVTPAETASISHNLRRVNFPQTACRPWWRVAGARFGCGCWPAKSVLPLFTGTSSETLRKVPDRVQIDTTLNRQNRVQNHAFIGRHHSLNRTAVA